MAKDIVGVGFLLFKKTKDGLRIFTVEELKDKPEILKEAGMKSPPLETQEVGDGNYEGTIRRLVEEEIGIDWKHINFLGISPRVFKLIPGREDISTVYGFGVIKEGTPEDFNPVDIDIKFAGWRSPEELSGLNGTLVRIESSAMVSDFFENHAHLLED